MTPGNGTYGQSESITVQVVAGAGLPVPTGTVAVKIDTASTNQTLVNGAFLYTPPTLSAGSHTVTATYSGDQDSSPSAGMPVTFTLAQLPLTVVVNSATKAYGAAIPHVYGNCVRRVPW